MIQISCFLQVGASIAAILSVELYDLSGWVAVSFGVASFNVLPLTLVPFFKRFEVLRTVRKDVWTPISATRTTLTWKRTFAFYFSDAVLFVNNAVMGLIAFVLPARIVNYTGRSLKTAVVLLQINIVISIISALALSLVTDRLKIFGIQRAMAIGNVIYHIGVIMAFGATTSLFRFLNTKTQLVVGSVLLGLGKAFHLNLCIPSKFNLYERWCRDKTGLGEQAARISNIALNLSSALGAVISAFSLTDDSGVFTVAVISGLCVFLTLGLLIVRNF